MAGLELHPPVPKAQRFHSGLLRVPRVSQESVTGSAASTHSLHATLQTVDDDLDLIQHHTIAAWHRLSTPRHPSAPSGCTSQPSAAEAGLATTPGVSQQTQGSASSLLNRTATLPLGACCPSFSAAATAAGIDNRHAVMALTLHTNLGDVKLELFCEQTPRTCENFLALCASGYYNDTKFHRNIKGFMIQGGDPTGTGKGGRSIYATPNGKFADEIHEGLKHGKRGILSMANSGPNTNASQFFITYKAHAHLNGKYTVFGHVIDGLDTLDRMEKVPCDAQDRPKQDIVLQKVTIHANPMAS